MFRNKDSHIVVNGTQVFFCFIFLLVILFCSLILTLPEEEIGLIEYVALVFFIVIFLAAYTMLPQYCRINGKGIQIVYGFGLKLTADWDQIRKIYLTHDISRNDHIRNQYLYNFVEMTGEKAFFMESHFPHTPRLESLLRQYAKVNVPKIPRKKRGTR